MKKVLREIFSDESGVLSSKRILGSITLFFAMGLTTYSVITGDSTEPFLGWAYGASSTLLGAGIIEKFARRRY